MPSQDDAIVNDGDNYEEDSEESPDADADYQGPRSNKRRKKDDGSGMAVSNQGSKSRKKEKPV